MTGIYDLVGNLRSTQDALRGLSQVPLRLGWPQPGRRQRSVRATELQRRMQLGVLETNMIKKNLCLALLLAATGVVHAAQLNGRIVGGGGIDDAFLDVQTADGRQWTLYCVDRCGDWFDEDAESGGLRLKRGVRNQRISVEYRTAPNQDRIAGPGSDDPLHFIRRARLLR